MASTQSTAFDQAEKLILDGRLPEARAILVTLCEQDPRNAESWLLLAAIDERFGLHQEAMGAYRQVHALEPGSPEVGLAQARLSWREGDWDRAVARSLAVADADPSYLENTVFAARGMRLLGRAEQALELANQGLDSAPGNAPLWAERIAAECDAAGGDVASAVRTALEIGPDDEWLRLQLAKAAGTASWDLAIQLLDGPFRDAGLRAEAAAWLCAMRREPLSGEARRALLSRYYDDVADTHDYHHDGASRDLAHGIQRLVDDLLGNDRRSFRLADIGCGTGLVAGYLADGWRQRTGVDMSRAMLSRAVLKRRFDNVFRGDWDQAFGMLRGGFDVVLALDAIGDSDDPRAFIAECSKTLKPGGLAVVTRGGRRGVANEPPLPVSAVDDNLDAPAVEAGLVVIDRDRVRRALGASVLSRRKCDVYQKPRGSSKNRRRDRRHDLDPPRRSGLESLLDASRRTAQGDARGALPILRSLLATHGERPEILFRLGFAHQSAGDPQAAGSTYARLLELDPDDPVGLFQMATVHQTLGEPAKAGELYGRALKADPLLAVAAFNLSAAAEEQGELAKALDAARRADSLEPWNAVFADRLARLERSTAEGLKQQCRSPEADSIEGQVVRASNHHRRGNQYQAIALLEPLLPDLKTNSTGIAVLAGAYRKSGRMVDAERVVLDALDGRPDDPVLREALAGMLAGKGELMAALREWDRACAVSSPDAGEHSNRLFMYNYSERLDGGEIARAHRGWGRALESIIEVVPPDHLLDRNPDRPLRLGYVSGDFHTHAVNCFVEPVLRHHDAVDFEVFCYSNTDGEDEATERIRFYTDHWRRIRHLDDDRAAAMVVNDRIDILVDLSGHTGHHRLGIFARKPAPIQATWIGYPNTTGLERIDYRITDYRADPPGDADADYSETLLRLPQGFHVFQPPPDAPPTWTDLDPVPTSYTFGCCNNIYKVTPDVVQVWSAILHRVKDSTIVLKSHSFDNDELYENVWGAFEKNGIDRRRVKLMSAISSTDHMNVLQRVEVGLDPFPYNGTTTTCDTLWMGVPVVTLAGDRHAARVGASILGNIGLHQLVATDRDEYISIAVDLALDEPRRKRIRSELRDRMRCSPLMDYPGFTRSLERELRRIWKAWCSGSPRQS